MPELKSGFVENAQTYGDGDVLVHFEGRPIGVWFPPETQVHAGELVVYTKTTELAQGLHDEYYYKLITKEEYESMNTS